jgi:hypothetical protein
MEEWISFIHKIEHEITRLSDKGCDFPFFRGHNQTQWKLIPSYFRQIPFSEDYLDDEESLHCDFSLFCGPLYDRRLDSWEILFEMRHAGIPTRLLDWTENFASALYFALNYIDCDKNSKLKKKLRPCIWIMDPYELNRNFSEDGALCFIDDLEFSYEELLENESKKSKKLKKITGPVAVFPPRLYQRSFAQKSVYTLHLINYKPIEEICKSCVKKIEIPLNSIEKAKKFLQLAGVNDYSQFPDPDGLGKYLIKKYELS